jgi:hypothetical protein
MTSLRTILSKSKTLRGRRWIIRRDSSNKIIEVKMIFDPHIYITYRNAKKMYGDKELLKILNKEYTTNGRT